MSVSVASDVNALAHVKGLPLAGILPRMMGNDPFGYLKSIMLEHGDFVAVQVGPMKAYLISGPDAMQHVLRDNVKHYRKPDMLYRAVSKVAENGLVVSTGDLWLRQRRMIQPHLHRKQLENLIDDMIGAIRDVLDEWQAETSHTEAFDVSGKMARITSEVIARTMFGKGLVTDEEITTVNTALIEVTELIGKVGYFGFLPDWVPVPGKKRFEEANAAMRPIILNLIQRCRDNPDQSAGLIRMLIESVDEETNETMTNQQLYDEAATIFTAGYETTAVALSWLWIVLDQNPDVVRRIRDELDQELAGREPTFADVPKLTYIRQVLMETLRMYPVGPLAPRAANVPDVIQGHSIPKDATVLLSFYGLHHNPTVWEDPDRFYPDRFTKDAIDNRHAFAFLPFSGGPRKCVGDEFALMEGVLVIAMVMQRFDIRIVPGQDFTPEMGITLRPAKVVNATVKSVSS